MDSNNIFFKIVVGVVLVGYMAFIFYQSLKGGLAYKKEFENFKNSHKHYETMVDGGYWVGVMVAMAASWVSISTNLVIAQSYDAETGKLTDVTLGSKLDGAFPKILTMLFVLFAWWLMAKKNITPIKVLLLFVVIGFVGSVVGFLG